MWISVRFLDIVLKVGLIKSLIDFQIKMLTVENVQIGLVFRSIFYLLLKVCNGNDFEMLSCQNKHANLSKFGCNVMICAQQG